MDRTEHLAAIGRGDLKRRVVAIPTRDGLRYVAWTRTWEGPARPDYAAALADLSERAPD